MLWKKSFTFKFDEKITFHSLIVDVGEKVYKDFSYWLVKAVKVVELVNKSFPGNPFEKEEEERKIHFAARAVAEISTETFKKIKSLEVKIWK